jgi:hypothetical protein
LRACASVATAPAPLLRAPSVSESCHCDRPTSMLPGAESVHDQASRRFHREVAAGFRGSCAGIAARNQHNDPAPFCSSTEKSWTSRCPGWTTSCARNGRSGCPSSSPVTKSAPCSSGSTVCRGRWLLLYGSGLRVLECCRLRLQDIDFARNQIVVRSNPSHLPPLVRHPPPRGPARHQDSPRASRPSRPRDRADLHPCPQPRAVRRAEPVDGMPEA